MTELELVVSSNIDAQKPDYKVGDKYKIDSSNHAPASDGGYNFYGVEFTSGGTTLKLSGYMKNGQWIDSVYFPNSTQIPANFRNVAYHITKVGGLGGSGEIFSGFGDKLKEFWEKYKSTIYWIIILIIILIILWIIYKKFGHKIKGKLHL